MTKKKAGATVAGAYRQLVAEIEVQMEILAASLEGHRERHEANPKDRGCVDDLLHVRDLLNNVLAFPGFGWKEATAPQRQGKVIRFTVSEKE